MHLMGKVGHDPKIGHCCPLSAIHTLCTAYTCTMRIVILLGTSILVSWYIRGGIKLCCDPPPKKKKKGHSSFWSFMIYEWINTQLVKAPDQWSHSIVMDMIHGNTVWPYFVILCLRIFKASWTMKALLK